MRRRRLKEGIVITKLGNCFMGRIGQSFNAIPHLGAPKPRHAVDDLVAVCIPKINTFAIGNHARLLRM